MAAYEDDCERLSRWIASLRKTSAATRAEADARGPAWEYHALSLASADAQAKQAEELASQLQAINAANRRWSP